MPYGREGVSDSETLNAFWGEHQEEDCSYCIIQTNRQQVTEEVYDRIAWHDCLFAERWAFPGMDGEMPLTVYIVGSEESIKKLLFELQLKHGLATKYDFLD